MQAGIVYGYVGLVDGIVNRIERGGKNRPLRYRYRRPRQPHVPGIFIYQ